jgi:hypothetical protein
VRNRWADEFERDFERSQRSPACVNGAHQVCPHLLNFGGGFNPRRLRPEFGAGLCRCSCHAACPVVIADGRLTVPIKAWRASCTCPGGERERRRQRDAGFDNGDFGELWDQARRRSRARKEAFAATRARASGSTRAQIRQIYTAELLARGLKVPPEQVLDAVVDRICGNPLPAATVLIESMAQMGKGLYQLSRLLRQRK